MVLEQFFEWFSRRAKLGLRALLISSQGELDCCVDRAGEWGGLQGLYQFRVGN